MGFTTRSSTKANKDEDVKTRGLGDAISSIVREEHEENNLPAGMSSMRKVVAKECQDQTERYRVDKRHQRMVEERHRLEAEAHTRELHDRTHYGAHRHSSNQLIESDPAEFENGHWMPNDRTARFRTGGTHSIETFETPSRFKEANSHLRAAGRQSVFMERDKYTHLTWFWSIIAFMRSICDFLYDILRSPPCILALGFIFACCISSMFAMMCLDFLAGMIYGVQ
jgi:hypothetical protein